MNFNLQEKTVSKLRRRRTPEATVTFGELEGFINTWAEQIGSLLICARREIDEWRQADRPPNQVYDVLHEIVVKFGEGKHRPWGTHVEKFLKSPNGNKIANDALTTIDENLTALNDMNILNLFGQLALIKGLGSKRHRDTSLISDCSYASKVPRCLSDEYVVLDDLLEDELGEQNYIEFRRKCDAIGSAMNPPRLAAKVEGGLYAWLQVLKTCQRKSRWKIAKIEGTP